MATFFLVFRQHLSCQYNAHMGRPDDLFECELVQATMICSVQAFTFAATFAHNGTPDEETWLRWKKQE